MGRDRHGMLKLWFDIDENTMPWMTLRELSCPLLSLANLVLCFCWSCYNMIKLCMYVCMYVYIFDGRAQELWDEVEEAMLQRLQDKAPKVRAAAAGVLARLAAPDDVNIKTQLALSPCSLHQTCPWMHPSRPWLRVSAILGS